jgi:hypothetical protein
MNTINRCLIYIYCCNRWQEPFHLPDRLPVRTAVRVVTQITKVSTNAKTAVLAKGPKQWAQQPLKNV